MTIRGHLPSPADRSRSGANNTSQQHLPRPVPCPCLHPAHARALPTPVTGRRLCLAGALVFSRAPAAPSCFGCSLSARTFASSTPSCEREKPQTVSALSSFDTLQTKHTLVGLGLYTRDIVDVWAWLACLHAPEDNGAQRWFENSHRDLKGACCTRNENGSWTCWAHDSAASKGTKREFEG